MKKILLLGIVVLLGVPTAFATLVTNMNQSALYFRLLSRNASTDIDAAFYNPAGLVMLKNGWHLQLNNQTIFQEKIVTNDFIFLNENEYVGKVNVPVFPDFYAVYKKDKLALSFGFGPNSGGGTADFSKGLPSFETQIASLPALISSLKIPTTAYSVDIAFKGKSVFYGFQLNASYAFTDQIAGALGMRYISATNSYEGSIRNIMINPRHPLINPTGQMMPASQFFGLIGQAAYAAATKDKEVDVKQTGSGVTPILSLSLYPARGLNIGIKYEFNTKLTLTNKTTKDDVGMFPDGEETHNDIPAIFSLGMGYELTPKLRASVSYNYFFDKNANWDGREEFVESNSWDLGFGLEYDLARAFSLSVGYLRTQFKLGPNYQSDFSHDMSADSFGFGARIRLGQVIDLDLGFLYSDYKVADKTITYPGIGAFREKYERSNLGVGVGVGFHF